MVDRTRVGELRQATQLQPRATPTQTFYRAEEADLSKARRFEQISGALDKMAGVSQDMATAQFEQRSREREADQVLLATRNFTNWSQGLDQNLWNLEPEQFQAAIDGKFQEFMTGQTDPNLRTAYTNMYADFYTSSVGSNADKFRERQQSDRMGLLTDRLWSAVRDPNLDTAGRNAAIEEVIAFARSEYNIPPNTLNDWLVQQQYNIAQLPDQDENFAILDWMDSNNISNVGRYAEQVSYIRGQKTTMDGITAEVARAKLFEDIQKRQQSGQRTDRAFLTPYVESGLLTAAQQESLLADEDKWWKEQETAQLTTTLVNQGVNSVVGGDGGYALPSAVQQDAGFTTGAAGVASRLNIPVGWLYAVMGFETGGTFNPAEPNRGGSGATGLIQFMPSTAVGLGTTTEALAGMSRSEQLAYVEKFYAPYAGKIHSASDLYLATLYPYALDQGGDYVLGSHESDDEARKVASQNAIFDTNGDGYITKNEVASYYNSSSYTAMYTGPSTGIAGLVTQDVTMPNGTTLTATEYNTQLGAAYTQRSEAISQSLMEDPATRVSRELREFWGRTGGTVVNPQWKQALEAGYHMARNQDGTGSAPNEVSQMAYMLYQQMDANAPQILNAYTTPEMRDYFEAVKIYEQDLKQPLPTAFASARAAALTAGSPSEVEDRAKVVSSIVDDKMVASDGWFSFEKRIGNIQQIQAVARRTVDHFLTLGLNPEQAEKATRSRMEQDYTVVGTTLVRTDNIQIINYPRQGLNGFVADMDAVMKAIPNDALYKDYLETQGATGEITLVQDPYNDNRFSFRDSNFNAIPVRVAYTDPETNETSYVIDPNSGFLGITTEMLPSLADAAWTANRMAEQEQAAAREKQFEDSLNYPIDGQGGHYDGFGSWIPDPQ